MPNKTYSKAIACVVIVAFLAVSISSSAMAAEPLIGIKPLLLAQASDFPASNQLSGSDEFRVRQQVYENKIQSLETDIQRAREGTQKFINSCRGSLYGRQRDQFCREFSQQCD